MMVQILYRSVDERIRYYSFAIYPNLFGEFLLERRYGSLKNRCDTRVLKSTYTDLHEAQSEYKRFLDLKLRRGYHEKRS